LSGLQDFYFENVEENNFNKIYRAKTPVKQNPKFEYRNPKQTRRSKRQSRNPKRACLELSDFLPFEIVSNFGFRISNS